MRASSLLKHAILLSEEQCVCEDRGAPSVAHAQWRLLITLHGCMGVRGRPGSAKMIASEQLRDTAAIASKLAAGSATLASLLSLAFARLRSQRKRSSPS